MSKQVWRFTRLEQKLENINRIVGLDYCVGAACGAASFGRGQERGGYPHQEIENSLVVVLVLPFRVIRDGTEECPKHRHRFVQFPVVKGIGKADDEGVAPALVDVGIAGQQALEQALADFLVRDGEFVKAATGAEPLDGQVAALVKDGHGVCRTFRRDVEHVGSGLDALGDFFGVDVECKHVAAAMYGIGKRLDENPFYFFTLRGLDADRLINVALENKVEKMLANADRPSDRIIPEGKLNALFGVV